MATATSSRGRAAWALAEIGNAQKSGVGVPAYTRWVNRRLARYPAALAYAWGLGPNAVSLVSFFTSAVGLAILVLSDPHQVWIGVVVAVLLAAGFVLDSADGQLARLSGASGPAGEWLDHLLDAVRSPAVHLSILVVGLGRGESPVWIAWVAFFFALTQVGQFSSQMLGGMLLDRTAGPRTPPRKYQSWILLPTDTGVTCWMFVLWGFPAVFGTFYGILFALCLAHALISVRRRFHELKQAGERM